MAFQYRDTTSKYEVGTSFYENALDHTGMSELGNFVRAAGESIGETFTSLLGGNILWKPLFNWLGTHDETNRDVYLAEQEYMLESDRLNNSNNKTTLIIVAAAVVLIAVLLLKK